MITGLPGATGVVLAVAACRSKCRKLRVAGNGTEVPPRLALGGQPDIRTKGNWSVARWSDDDWVFVLMGKEGVDAKRREGMF